jgi:putative membrane-bound dehydrogenase-like protein
MLRNLVILAAITSAIAPLSVAAPVSLFDGKSLAGWEIRKGEEKWWKIGDGMIVGGSLTEQVPFNTFISSVKNYENFELGYQLRLVKGEGFMNSGMQIRSQRSDKDSEMSGYQVDAGSGYWGDLYDESRRNIALAKGNAAAAKDWEWNTYRVRCEGARIRTWINDVLVTDYTEKDPQIPLNGRLGLQTHGGGKVLVQMKDISIDELPATNGSQSPEAQRAGFKLPAGYTAELVASEEQGVGKPVALTWDRHGKMWTTTALEYPVDANENEASARELYKTGGKDKVLVFDDPNQPGPLTPRVFVDKLAIPLGVLPTDDGVLVQHGPEIRRYRDSDGDGKADGFEVVLEGFGIQDSHLFPHQFEHAPGGWIYLAQGAFNYSKVKRPGETTAVDFNNCKLARFRPDGSGFEALTGGPNNIWGLAISRNGETYMQEANDMGYPVAEFIAGTNYRNFSSPKLREDGIFLPESTPGVPIGGTGLSGLALAEDTGSPFAKNQDGAVFYLANPITSKLQIVTMTRDAKGHPAYKIQGDFMTTPDPWFRPIAVRFGPDGCLYVVDWYNKIISHNEIPRNHPDRDKTRGRIWRIRHESQKAVPARDLAKLSDTRLLAVLDDSNALVAAHVWQELAARKSDAITQKLTAIFRDPTQSETRRCSALWAVEDEGISSALLAELAASPEAALRNEAIRIAGEHSLAEADFLGVSDKLENEPHFRVRAALANAVRSHTKPTAKIIASAARLGLEPLENGSRDAYDRNFERYLARWAMSAHPEATREMLASIQLPVEARLLAARSFDAAEAATEMVKLLPDIKRPLVADELALLGSQLRQETIARSLRDLLNLPEKREPMLRALLQIDASIASDQALANVIGTACKAMLEDKRTPAREHLMVELSRKFGLTAMSAEVAKWMKAPGATPAQLSEGLATLRRIGVGTSPAYASYLDHADDTIRREALIGFSSSTDSATVVPVMATRWADMPGALRSLAVTGMTSNKASAEIFAKAMAEGGFPGFDGTAVEKIIASLGTEHPSVAAMLKSNEGLLQPVLRLGDSGEGRIVTDISLKGAFTIETWIKLDKGIDNQDSLLGRRDGPDFNFYGERLHIWGGSTGGDILVADRPTPAEVWTHCAITRDAEGHFTIYQNGEADPAKGGAFPDDYAGLNLGENFKGQHTAASYDEFRIWKTARDGAEIRRDMRTRFSQDALPAGLVLLTSGRKLHGTLDGGAKISLTRDFPSLVTPEEATALDAKFARFRKLAEAPGDAASGKDITRATCLICHQINGEGAGIGPNLSGAGAMGVEALLRNILTPNAQLESGYYRHDITRRDGTVASGFLVSENENTITLRQIGTDDVAIRRENVLSHDISRRSLMPEGLIDGFAPQQVTDLFAYLKSLR